MYDGRVLLISVIVPVCTGDTCLEDLVGELSELRKQLEDQTDSIRLGEAIFVDDGAADESPELLNRLQEEYDWLTVLHLARSYGQHPATIAGILHSSGDWVITLEDARQHPTSAIPQLLRKAWAVDADIIYARAVIPAGRTVLQAFVSSTYRRLMSGLTGVKDILKFSSFRLVRGAIARAASSVCGPETDLDIALSWFTSRIESIDVTPREITSGSVAQTSSRRKSLLSHTRRLAFSGRINALRLGVLTGAMISGACAVALFCLTLLTLFDRGWTPLSGWGLLLLALIFVAGLILMLLGLSLEYLTLLAQKAHGRPVFFTVDRSADRLLRELEGLPLT